MGVHLRDDLAGTLRPDPGLRRRLIDLRAPRPAALARHQQRVLAARTAAEAQVIGRGQAPGADGVHQEGVVLRVVVAVQCADARTTRCRTRLGEGAVPDGGGMQGRPGLTGARMWPVVTIRRVAGLRSLFDYEQQEARGIAVC